MGIMNAKKIRLYNTLTRQKEELQPRDGKKLKMFVCGPTVYDIPHLGNMRSFVSFDMIAKWLRHRGFKLTYIQNITDIDDKIINRAKEAHTTARKVARKFEKYFHTFAKALKITSVDKYPRASKNIRRIYGQIAVLIAKGHAYAVPAVKADGLWAVNEPRNKDVYFDVSSFSEYGKLSRQKLSQLESGTRTEVEANKKNPHDFALWKAQNYAYEPAWRSPWGMGRPGWHIEDTAITERYFGQQYDIHGGGLDLIFPHHEAEIAQQESVSGKKPFVKYWMHSGLLTVSGEKMSKSAGNFVQTHDALIKYSLQTLRLFFFNTHYRAPVDYSDETLAQFEAGVDRIAEFKTKLEKIRTKNGNDVGIIIREAKRKFENSMDDDFSTPQAIASIFELIRTINPLIDQQKLSKRFAKEILVFLKEIDGILNIIPPKAKDIPSEITRMADTREKLRRDKRYSEADDMRHQIELKGYILNDTPYGPLIRKK